MVDDKQIVGRTPVHEIVVADTQPAEPKAPNVDVTGRISPDEPPKKSP